MVNKHCQYTSIIHRVTRSYKYHVIDIILLTYNAKATFSQIVDGPQHNTNPQSPVMYMGRNSISNYQDNSVYKAS